MIPRPSKCSYCEESVVGLIRGLCKPCYTIIRRHGNITDYPRKLWKSSDLAAEVIFWRSQGKTTREAADKLGVTLSAARRAVQRARERDDRAGP